jgi:ergothioneine biosynthesis protein EgtB
LIFKEGVVIGSETLAKAVLKERYRNVRSQTEAICQPLAIDDYQVQSVPEVSPPKWHLAHVSWFFETFLLKSYLKGYRPMDPRFVHLFNSYYVTVGTYHPRAKRGVLSRPTVEQVYAYRAHVDQCMFELIENCPEKLWDSVGWRIELGLNHEQQHQELLLMDIKRNFFENPLFPAYSAAGAVSLAGPSAFRWLEFAGGLKHIGHDGPGFCFDNERPRHEVSLRDYRLGSRLVTNGEYLEFIQAGGYLRPELWLSDGWNLVCSEGWRAPLYWIEVEGRWHEMTLQGLRPLKEAEPVCHVSYYEADAFARWRGARLPTEAEWESAVAYEPMAGNFLETGLLHPRPSAAGTDRQWFGDLWEWTSSHYSPYPGFRPLEGSLGEYNGKFMANQFVLRGGCCVTPRSHIRPTYRNFFYPRDRWQFGGIRLASDAQ